MGERRDPTGPSQHVASIRSGRTNAERDDPAVPFRSDNSACSTGRAGDLFSRRDEEGRSHRSPLCWAGRYGRSATDGRPPGTPSAFAWTPDGCRDSPAGCTSSHSRPCGTHTYASHHGGPLSAGCAPERSPAQLLQQKSRPQRREGGMAGPGGFEPPTLGSEGRCSIQAELQAHFGLVVHTRVHRLGSANFRGTPAAKDGNA